MSKVVITMPAYRAEQTLAKTVADIPEGVADELILVDDASPDNTVQLARELGGIKVVVHDKNRGYGGNQKTCYTHALAEGADIVVLLHPDYQYEPKAVPLLIAPILAGNADMTFGSRFAGMGDPRNGGMPMYRFIGNRVTTILQNLILGCRFTEMHSGMRAYTRGCLLEIPFLRYSDNFAFDQQFLVDAVISGQRVVEVPIPTRYTKESSSISIGRSLSYVLGGLAHSMRQAAAYGRRGKRWPSRQTGEGLPVGAAYRPPYDERRIRTIERQMGAFANSGPASVAAAPGDAAPNSPGLVVTQPLEAFDDPVAVLGAFRQQIAPEALLAIGTRAAAGQMNHALQRAGFRMLAWESEHGENVLIARAL